MIEWAIRINDPNPNPNPNPKPRISANPYSVRIGHIERKKLLMRGEQREQTLILTL